MLYHSKLPLVCLLAGILFGAVAVYSITPSLSPTISGGIYPSAVSYTIWKEGVNYFAKSATGSIDFSDDNASWVVQSAESITDDAGGILYLKGFSLPVSVVLSPNVLVIEEYGGKLTYYNELTNRGKLEDYFTTIAGHQTDLCYPIAYCYHGDYNRTYVIFQSNDEMSPYITAFDHEREIWLDAVRVGDNPLWTTKDYHGSPCLMVDDAGYIHAFWGFHDSTGTPKHSKSTNSEDISAWTAQADLSIHHPSYPSLFKQADGDIYLFYRSDSGGAENNEIRFVASADNMATWSSETTIVQIDSANRVYADGIDYDSANERFHFSLCYLIGGSLPRENVFHLYYKVSDGHVYNMAGTDLGTTAIQAELLASCVVYSSGSTSTWSKVRVSPTGTPAIIWQNGAPYGTYQCVRWTGAAWSSAVQIPYPAPSSNHSCGYPEFEWVSSTEIHAYLAIKTPLSEVVTGHWGGDVVRFISKDSGATWRADCYVLSASKAGFPIQQSQLVAGDDRLDSFKLVTGVHYHLFWNTTDSDYTRGVYNLGAPLFAWGENGFVYRSYKW